MAVNVNRHPTLTPDWNEPLELLYQFSVQFPGQRSVQINRQESALRGFCC